MALNWTPKLATGLAFADADHQGIIALLDRLWACIEAREAPATTGSALHGLIDVVGLHFAREERLQERCGNPEIDVHRREHADFRERLRRVGERFDRDPAGVGLDQIHRLVSDWFADHISGFDARMGQHCSGDAAAAAEAGRLGFDGPGTWPDWTARRFLVVDGNPQFCDLLRTLLGVFGAARVYAAATPREGLARLSHSSIDLLLCDLNLEGRNGLDFVRGLRRDGVTTPMVVMGNAGNPDFRAKAPGAGANGALDKPLGAAALVRTLQAALR